MNTTFLCVQYPELIRTSDNAIVAISPPTMDGHQPKGSSGMANEMRCLIPESDESSSTANEDRSGRDLLTRLLEIDPQKRLRSLYALERIAMYKNYSFADVRMKKARRIDIYIYIFVN